MHQTSRPRAFTQRREGPYSSQWQAAMDAEMASWKSTGTYVEEVPPPGVNIVSGMWIFRLRCPHGFTGSFPAGTQWSLRRPVYGLRQARREWHDTLRMTLASLGFAPSTADPSLFFRTDTTLPPSYVLVYVEDLVFATADTEALAHVKSELQKRHTCTDLGKLTSYLGLRITRDRAQRTITLTQSDMVQQVPQRFGFTYSSPQSTPLPTSHSLLAPPSDESVEPSGPYPELVGCLMYPMTCTRPDFAYPLSLLARYVALGRHRKGDCYLCVPPDLGIAAAALGASEFGTLPGTAPAEALHTFTLDSGASRCFFRDSTTLTPLPAPVLVRLADPSGGPVVARSSTVLPCPAVLSGSLSGLHLPSFSTNLTLLWHHRLGHPSLPRLRGMHSRLLGRERYFFLVVEDYTRYTTVFPLRSKGEVVDVLIPWIRTVRLQLRERFGQNLPVLHPHSDKGGEFSSNLLWDLCRGKGILQSITLPDSPQQNGIAERRIGLVMEVARTSMIHAAAPHFLAAGSGGARTRGAGAPGTSGVGGAGVGDPTEPGASGAGGSCAGETGAGGAGAGGAGVGGSGAGRAGAGVVDPGAGGAGGTVQPRLYFVPLLQQVLGVPSSTGLTPPLLCQPPDQSQLPLQPASPLPAPSPYTEQSGGLTKRREPASFPVSPLRTARRTPCSRPPPVPGTHTMALHPSSVLLRVPLPAPPQSSLLEVPDPEFDRARAASSTVSRLLTTVITDLSFESAAASTLFGELLDFAASYRLDYATALVAESASASPPSVGGECALGTDVLEDRKEDFECLAAAVPRFASMLLAPEGDPDAPDILTPRSYAEAITGPYSSQWQAAMDAEMASWKSRGTYIDEVPPLGANIVDGKWIFRRDYELHSLDFSRAFLQGSMHKEIWLRRPPSFTESFLAGTERSLWRPVYGLRQAPREWHGTLRTTLAALGFAPATADPSLFLRTDTSLPPFYVLVYVDELVFATADIEALTLVKSKL
ncbi:unnamed protein product [Closterium sp. NIES-53]